LRNTDGLIFTHKSLLVIFKHRLNTNKQVEISRINIRVLEYSAVSLSGSETSICSLSRCWRTTV